MSSDVISESSGRAHDRESAAKALLHEQKKLALVQEISRALSSALDLDTLLALIMQKMTELMGADRSTLYLLTEDRKQLWSKVFQGGEVEEFRLNVGEGIAGWVAKSGETVNIPDAYTDERFQPRVDLKSGYRTKSILCAPMRDSTGDVVGVLQLLNKKDGTFSAEDEELLTALGSQAAISIENAKLYQSVVAKNVALQAAKEELQHRTDELNVLYEIERELNEARDLDELLDRLVHRAMSIVGARSGSIALRESDSDRLRFRTTAGPAAERLAHRTLPVGTGLIGWVVARGEPAIINDPTSDTRHAAEFAAESEVAPESLACAPLIISDEVVGGLELIDKVGDGAGFTDEDLKLLTLIAGQASRAIAVATGKQELEDQDRLAAIGQMLAGVLHDLKTPMTIISGYAQLMAQMADAGERERYVDEILNQFELMNGMTRAVLAFARGESNVLVRKVYLNRFFEQVGTQLKYAFAGRSVDLVIEPEYEGAAMFDEQSMLRLIQNLARNAVDAMAPDGGQFKILCRTDGRDLYFDFVDDGPGIPADLEGRVFELFASRTDGGSGLGLAICKKIVDDHGGSIGYESVAGQGTTFHVRLPAALPGERKSTSGD